MFKASKTNTIIKKNRVEKRNFLIIFTYIISDDVMQLTSKDVFIIGLQVLKVSFDCFKASVSLSRKCLGGGGGGGLDFF